MKKNAFCKIAALLLMCMIVSTVLTGCMTNRHTIGNGVQTGAVQKTRQWYALWGLVKLGDSDTKNMVGNTADYTIETYYGAVDWLINFFLGGFTIQSRTVKVTK